MDLTECNDSELAQLQRAVRDEQQRRYQRDAAPQQLTSALNSALEAGVPAEDIRRVVEDCLPGAPGSYFEGYTNNY